MSTQVQEHLDLKLSEALTQVYELVLYNDEVNTFDHVIDCLVNYCKHSWLQAEQCAHIVHFNGKCLVKYGSKEVLLPMYEALLDQGLSVKLEY